MTGLCTQWDRGLMTFGESIDRYVEPTLTEPTLAYL